MTASIDATQSSSDPEELTSGDAVPDPVAQDDPDDDELPPPRVVGTAAEPLTFLGGK